MEKLDQTLPVLERRLAADIGVGAGAKPLVTFVPNCTTFSVDAWSSAWESVLTQTNSTPSTALATMCSTALPPPPPTPITRMTALLEFWTYSNPIACSPCGNNVSRCPGRGAARPV